METWRYYDYEKGDCLIMWHENTSTVARVNGNCHKYGYDLLK